MKKINRKILFVLIITIISILSMTLQAYAGNVTDYEYTYSNMDENKAAQIVNKMLAIPNDSPVAQPAGIFCIFGHAIQTGTVTLTEHNVYTTAPRCRVTTSFVEYCTRSSCDYYKVLSQAVSYAFCH